MMLMCWSLTRTKHYINHFLSWSHIDSFIHLSVLSSVFPSICHNYIKLVYCLLDSLVVECWLRVREVPGSIPSQGPRHTKDVIKMVPVALLFSTEHSKGKCWLFLKNKDRKINVMDKIWDRKFFEVRGHWPLWWRGWKKRMTTKNRQKSNAKKTKKNIKLYTHSYIDMTFKMSLCLMTLTVELAGLHIVF